MITGKTAIFVAIAGRPAGILAIADQIKAMATTTIRNFINTNRGHSPEGYTPAGKGRRLAKRSTMDCPIRRSE